VSWFTRASPLGIIFFVSASGSDKQPHHNGLAAIGYTEDDRKG
jgi:hypothetical protein